MIKLREAELHTQTTQAALCESLAVSQMARTNAALSRELMVVEDVATAASLSSKCPKDSAAA